MPVSLHSSFLLRDVVWRLSPHLLLYLTEHFSSILPDLFLPILSDDIRRLRDVHRFANLTPDSHHSLLKLQHAFIHALSSLRADSPAAERLMVIAHLLGMASHDSVRSHLSDILSDDDLSSPLQDYIISAYLRYGLEPIRLALRINLSARPKMFNYFVPGDAFLFPGVPLIPLCPDDERLHALRCQLSDFFLKKFHSAMCELDSGAHDRRFFLSITHAGPYKQDRRTKQDKPDNFVFQPVEYDTIVFDLLSHDLCIHMENEKPSVIREYIRCAGQLFFDAKAFWGEEQKFTLGPLQHATAASLASLLDPQQASGIIRPIGGGILLSIRLTEIVCKRACAKGATAERRSRNTRCLSRELAHADAPLIPEGFTLTSARLAFDYRTCEGCRKTARLLLTPRRKKLHQTSGASDELEGVEDWLAQSGFVYQKSTEQHSLPSWFREMSRNNRTLMSPRREEETILPDAPFPEVLPSASPRAENPFSGNIGEKRVPGEGLFSPPSEPSENPDDFLFAAEENPEGDRPT